MAISDLIENVVDMFTGHKDDEAATEAPAPENNGGVANGSGNILPASQDPLGDPANSAAPVSSQDQQAGILPASQDPLGDPADNAANSAQDRQAGIIPASQDPLGDPADRK